MDELREFILTLRHYGVGSVDWFLEEHPEFIAVGKAAIAACLIPLERHDRLLPPGAPAKHWYELLLGTLVGGNGRFDTDRLSVVTFNYDRSLEYYLFLVLKTRLGSADKARDALKRLNIVHVHGALGRLEPFEGPGRPYLPELTGDAVAVARDQILVVGEARDSSAEFERAAILLNQAERVFFLGFGFHPASVGRLKLFNSTWNEARRSKVEVLATARGVPPHAWHRICSEVLGGAIDPRTKCNHTVFDFLQAVHPLDI